MSRAESEILWSWKCFQCLYNESLIKGWRIQPNAYLRSKLNFLLHKIEPFICLTNHQTVFCMIFIKNWKINNGLIYSHLVLRSILHPLHTKKYISLNKFTLKQYCNPFWQNNKTFACLVSVDCLSSAWWLSSIFSSSWLKRHHRTQYATRALANSCEISVSLILKLSSLLPS